MSTLSHVHFFRAIMRRAVCGVASLGLLAFWAASAQDASGLRYADLQCGSSFKVKKSSYRNVITDLRADNTVSIEGANWDDTLILGCQVEGVNGDGIEIRNVRNLAIVGCKIHDVSGTGIRLRSSGSTNNVLIMDNEITEVGKNGISIAKRVTDDVDHRALVIAGNKIKNSGKRGKSGHSHGIYSQASDVTIFKNKISGARDGNGISIRSSGIIACNSVSGKSKSRKPGIRYFGNNFTGPSKTIIIRDNKIKGSSPAIDIMKPDSEVRRDPSALVRTIVIEDNLTKTNEGRVRVSPFWKYRSGEFAIIVNGKRIGGG